MYWMSNFARPLQYLNNPIFDFQKISKEFCDNNRNDTPRRVVIDKQNLKGKKGELVTIVAPYGGRKSILPKIIDGLDDPHPRKIDHRLVESISREIILVSEWFYCEGCQPSLNHDANEQIIPEFSPN